MRPNGGGARDSAVAAAVEQTIGSLGASQPGPHAIVGSDDGCERTATLYDVAAARPVRLTGKEVVVVSANGLPDAMDGELSWT